MASAKVAAVARTVLFRRVRSVLIRTHGEGLIAHTLNFDYEVRSAEEAFSDLPDAKADDEMLDLALHIIKKKAGRFDPTTFDDRYDAALVELVKAKMDARRARQIDRREHLADRSHSTASTKPIKLLPRSTTAGIWLRAQSG
jgi:DNA end-binding protein Ku